MGPPTDMYIGGAVVRRDKSGHQVYVKDLINVLAVVAGPFIRGLTPEYLIKTQLCEY